MSIVVQTGCTLNAVPKTLPKADDAPTPPMVPAAHESFTGNNLQEDCGDAADASNTTRRKKNVSVGNDKKNDAMPPPIKKRSASCRDEERENDKDSKECAAAIKLHRGEDGEAEQTRIVTTTCHNPSFDPDEIVEKYIQGEWVFSRRLV